MKTRSRSLVTSSLINHRAKRLLTVLSAFTLFAGRAAADTFPVQVLDPNLQVTTVLNAGITQPIGIVFLGPDDFLVLEKASGQVKRVIDGVIQATPVLDLAVNSALRARPAEHGAAPELPGDALRLRPLDREQHRRGHHRHGRRAAAGQPR